MARAALDVVFSLHRDLVHRGWIASDFYDGSLIYDFSTHRIQVVDLDNYRRGPFENTMGRMFGSIRFMAPEEHERGAKIDERTTVFTMGRTIQQLFVSSGSDFAEVAARACDPNPALRYQTMDEFYEAWCFAWASAALGTTGQQAVAAAARRGD
jgi:serine/threonine protein kinase, bacterial